MADLSEAELLAPMYLRLPEMPVAAPVVAECPACFAIVLTSRLADHQRASHDAA